MAGWLLKQGNSIKKDWRRRFVRIHDDLVLRYYDKDSSVDPLGEVSLLTCMVRPNNTIGKPYAFDLVTPKRTYYWAAKDSTELKTWIDTIQNAIQKAIESVSVVPQRMNSEASRSLPATSVSVARKPTTAWVYTQASTPTSGYLYKKTNGEFKKHFVEIRGDNIYFFPEEMDRVCQRRSSCPIVLTMCTVRTGIANSFIVVTPTDTLELQAETPEDAIKWITVFKNAATLYKRRQLGARWVSSSKPSPFGNEMSSTSTVDQNARILQIAAREYNRRCADCSEAYPQWASINIGIFICIECSGVHRSLGTHISKVRSISLDKWDKETVDFMDSMGNEKSNSIWEWDTVQVQQKKPKPSSSRADKTFYITQKYKCRAFCNPSTLTTIPAALDKQCSSSTTHSSAPAAPTAPTAQYEGYLVKQTQTRDGWIRYRMLLKQYLLMYSQPEATAPEGIIDLRDAHIQSSADISNAFEVAIPSDTLVFQAENSADFFHWMNVLKAAQQAAERS